MSNYIVNFDKFIEGETEKYDNPNKLTIIHPARVVIAGPSSCGKTNVILNLLFIKKTSMKYRRVLLYAKMLQEPKYQYMINRFVKIEEILTKLEKKPIKILYTSSDLSGVIPLEDLEDCDDIQTIAIFDDFICEENQEVIKNYWMFGRKFNVTSFFLGQSFHQIDKFIRDNSNYVILFRVNNYSDLRRIYNDVVKGVDFSDFKRIYDRALVQNINGFVTIDNVTPDNNRRVRIGIL